MAPVSIGPTPDPANCEVNSHRKDCGVFVASQVISSPSCTVTRGGALLSVRGENVLNHRIDLHVRATDQHAAVLFGLSPNWETTIPIGARTPGKRTRNGDDIRITHAAGAIAGLTTIGVHP